MKINPILLSDYYKQCHAEQYSDKITKLVSYYTPRMSRLEGEDKLIHFGLQGFIKEFLIEMFNENFFNRDIDELIAEYEYIMHSTMSDEYIDSQKYRNLHTLGYLPLEIKGVSEGLRVPIKVPTIEISNTHPDFAWVTNFIESILSAQLWYPSTIANQAYKYLSTAKWAYEQSVDEGISPHSAIAEFGFRGAQGLMGAILCSAAFLTSFNKTATVPAVPYLMQYYGAEVKPVPVATGMLSTEHSVMCSGTTIFGSEAAYVEHLLTNVYPTGNLSMVSDSYDYWNMVENIIGDELKDIITNRKGILFVRGDSGDPIDIVCGTIDYKVFDKLENFIEHAKGLIKGSISKEAVYGRVGDKIYRIDVGYIASEPYEVTLTTEEKGTVEVLYDKFGGTINSKGYKVLASCIRAIYGDSITPARAYKIYNRLMRKGFAANNVALGAGSFSMQCSEENGMLSPFTRDTYGIAIKNTHCELKSKEELQIFKDPKTDKDNFKKSQKGMSYVYRDADGEIKSKDEYTSKTIPQEGNLLETVFLNGKMVKETTIYEIRERLHGKSF